MKIINLYTYSRISVDKVYFKFLIVRLSIILKLKLKKKKLF